MRLDISSSKDRIQSAIIKAFKLAGSRFERGTDELELVVVIMDGAEDASVIALLLHRLDGKCSAGIFTPENLGPDNVGKNLAIYVDKGVKQRAFLVVLDQEDLSLKRIWRKIEDSLKNSGIYTYNVRKYGGRWRIYECSRGYKTFVVGIVVNGLNLPYSKHSIEDHLIELANKTMPQQLTNSLAKTVTSKEVWLKISKDNNNVQHSVYKAILNSEHVDSVFQQHVKAIENLRKIIREQRFACDRSST